MELLKRLTECFGPSGREDDISQVIFDEIKQYADDIQKDPLGNLIAKVGSGGKKIIICAHMDEIGVIITNKDEKGFYRFASVGGLRIKDLIGRRVVFKNGTEGVIGIENPEDKYTVSKMYIDTGNSDDLSIGDMGVFCGGFYTKGKTVISKALDNRAGCYVAIETIKQLKNPKNELYFIFTVQEEVGLRGAKTAAYSIDADYALAIDVTDTGDVPGDKPMAVKLSGGAAIKVMDRSVICHAKVRDTLIELASKNNIPYQLEVLTNGGTDAGAVHTTGSGIMTGAISIPAHHIHSPSEMVSIDDLNSCKELLSAFLREV